jgi:hypothetical protein
MRLLLFRKRLGRKIMPDDDTEDNSGTRYNELDRTLPIILMRSLMIRKALLMI